MQTRFLRSFLALIVSLSILQLANGVEPSPPTKSKSGGGQTPTPKLSPTATPKPLPPGAIDQKLFGEMKWRQVGPFRGGRALAIAGVAGSARTRELRGG